MVIEVVIGPLWLRLLLTGEPITDEVADKIVELVVNGARPAPEWATWSTVDP